MHNFDASKMNFSNRHIGVDSKAEKTLYPLIYRANEKFLSYKILWPSLDVLETSLERQDLSNSLEMLSKLVEEWEYKKDTKD